MKDTVCCIRNWVQGTALVSLLGVEGQSPSMVPHATPGNCLRDKTSNIRNGVQGSALVI